MPGVCKEVTCCLASGHAGDHRLHADAASALRWFEYNAREEAPEAPKVTGYKREGKLDLTIIPGAFVTGVAKVLLHGEVKHGRINYLTNPKVTDREILAAILRHAFKCVVDPKALDLCAGCATTRDPECRKCTGEPHIACVAADCAMLLHRWEKK